MQQLTTDYAAGLFDGEGCFSIHRARRKDIAREYSYQVHAQLAIKERRLVEMLRNSYGGGISVTPARKETHSDSYCWTVTGEGVASFCRIVGPRLVIKKLGAVVALCFQAYKRQSRNQPISDERYSTYERYYQAMRKINKRGQGDTTLLHADSTMEFLVSLPHVQEILSTDWSEAA